MTLNEAALALGVTESRVRQLVRCGRLVGRKVGRDDWEVDDQAVERRQSLMAVPPSRWNGIAVGRGRVCR